MNQPVANLDVTLPVGQISHNTVFCLQFGQPFIDEIWGVVIVGKKKAREHSRISAKPPRIVGECPRLDKCEPGIARNAAHAFGLRKLRLDASNPGHQRNPSSRSIRSTWSGDRRLIRSANARAFSRRRSLFDSASIRFIATSMQTSRHKSPRRRIGLMVIA